MTSRGAKRLARALLVVVVLELAASVVFGIREAAITGKPFLTPGDVAFLAGFLLFPIVGCVIASRQPRNAIGWIMLAVGISAFECISAYGSYAAAAGRSGAAMALTLSSWTWVPMIGLSGGLLLLLFPDGHLPSPRWKWFARAFVGAMIIAAFTVTTGGPDHTDLGYPKLKNPLYLEPIGRPLLILAGLSIATLSIGILVSAASLVVRYRRSDAIQRVQIRWLATAAMIVGVAYGITLALSALSANADWGEGSGVVNLMQSLLMLLFGLIPVSIGLAILRYRLYDINVVLKKTVIVAMIVVFVTVVYALIVVGFGSLIGGDSALLSAVAAAIVALVFLPALDRARRMASRLVYGKRATPLEVLSNFSGRIADVTELEEILPRMAQLIAEGTGATETTVWLQVGAGFVADARWPRELPVARASSLGDIPGDLVAPVRHGGVVLGALALAKPASDPVSPSDERLLEDLASQTGLVVRNVRLVEELRASRRRIVSAQDERAKKIERDLHDGVQQQLVALNVQLGLLPKIVAKDPDKAAAIAHGLQVQATDALEDLRDLARGIYPPLLADQGLAAALEAQARKAAVATRVRAEGVERYDRAVESAVYFCVLEALNNVAKYAGATNAVVSLSQDDGLLAFSVADDGDGFDTAGTNPHGTGLQGMADRLDAIGGKLKLTSSQGEGTTVTGTVPVVA